jgi:hypothetical protein
VHLLLSHGVKLEPNKMLTRCVVCNGSIEPVYNEDRRRDIFKSHQALDEINVEGLDVYQCNGCSQGYWWCEKPTSSASRVKCQANRLLELCIRGGVPIDSDLGMFSNIDVEKIRATKDELKKENELVEERLDVVQWLQVEDLKNPLPSSAYALKGTQKESLPFTNVTYDFVGNLDYILYQTQAMKVIDLLYVPKTFGELNDLNIANGHLLPSYDWPSDHLAIGCRISFRPVLENIEKENDQSFKSLKSGPISFPRGPPLAVPWCGFIDGSESDSVSEPTPKEASITSRTTVVSEETKDDSESDSVSEPTPKEASITSRNTVVPEETKAASLPHGERCGCGCVPNVPSLFEMAELRRQYRLSLKNGDT